MDNVLEVRNLSAFYPVRSEKLLSKQSHKQILYDVSFSIKKGEIVGLVGESGCGKSTLARAVVGLHRDYQGEIVQQSAHPQMVFQDTFGALNPAKTIGWLMAEAIRDETQLSKEDKKRKIVTMLETVGLSERYMQKYPSELSGGQRQRIGIAVALLKKPELLIADEPVSALDVTIQKQIVELLQRLREQKKISILFISHDLRVVYQLCDRVMIMKNGKIVESGDRNEVYLKPRQEYTKLLLQSAGLHQCE